MSVIGTLVAVPNRLRILWDILRKAGSAGLSRDELARRIVPPFLERGEHSVTPERNVFTGSLTELTRAGLASISHNRVIATEPTGLSSGSGHNCFVAAIERTLLAANIDMADERSALAGGIAWLLTRDPMRPLPWQGAPAAELLNDLGENGNRFDVTNESRWQNLAYWARYFGYASFLDVAPVPAVVPDPIGALRRHLNATLPVGREVAIGEFFTGLAGISPVFEGGTARRRVETGPGTRRGPREVSRSTAFALRRLQVQGTIEALRHDDAEIWTTPGLFDGRVSHLRQT